MSMIAVNEKIVQRTPGIFGHLIIRDEKVTINGRSVPIPEDIGVKICFSDIEKLEVFGTHLQFITNCRSGRITNEHDKLHQVVINGEVSGSVNLNRR